MARGNHITFNNGTAAKTKPGDSVRRVWDSEVMGFHLRVSPGGQKSWCITFTRKDGRKVNATLGDALAVPLKEARAEAEALRGQHDQGEDARAVVKAKRGGKSLTALVEVWEAEDRPRLKQSTLRTYDSALRLIKAELGEARVKDISLDHVRALYRKAKTGGHEAWGHKVVVVLSKLMTIAEREGWRPMGANPCRRMELQQPRKTRSRTLSAAEYAKLGSALNTLVKQEKLDPEAGDLFRFLAFSGCRLGEAQRLGFSDVNLERGTMTFIDHKTSKTAGPKVLPLNTHLRAIIQRRAGQMLGPRVFPGRGTEKSGLDGCIVGLTKMWSRLLGKSGIRDATPHDLRRTFMSTLCELGHPKFVGDVLLGHSLGTIGDTYTVLGTDGILATASQETSDWIAAAMAGKKVKPGVKFGKKPGAATA